MPMTMPQVKRRVRTRDRACVDGLGQSAISLNREADSIQALDRIEMEIYDPVGSHGRSPSVWR